MQKCVVCGVVGKGVLFQPYKGEQALSEVGLEEVDTISSSVHICVAIDITFLMYILHGPPKVFKKLALT